MDQKTLPLSQKRYRFDAFTAHCAGIIRIEIERRKLSARHLLENKVINHRNKFKERLRNGDWASDEFRALIEYLQIDMVRVTTSFLSSDPESAYNNGVYGNFSGIITALVQAYDGHGATTLPNMEPMREAVQATVANRVLDQLNTHNKMVTKARDTSPPTHEMAAH